MPPERRIPRLITGAALVSALAILVIVALVQAMGWYRFVPVLSGSMAPYIETGDLAVLQPVDATDLEVGDVIAFEAPIGDRQLMLHRVSEIVARAPELRIRTQGDANSSDDPWTARVTDDVLWRATDRIPALGQPVVFAHRVGTPTLIVVAGGLIFFALVLRRLWIIEPEDEEEPPNHRGAHGPVVRQPTESIVTMVIVAMVIVATLGLLLARPARATFTASAEEEHRVTFRSSSPPDPSDLPPPTDLRAQIVCDLLGEPTGVTLQWTSPDEAVDFITVERSSTPLLGEPEPFIPLARVAGSATGFKDDFATVDPPPSNPLEVQYRVRSAASDGATSTYSNTARVEPCIPEVPVTTTVPITTTVPVTTTVPITTVTTVPVTTVPVSIPSFDL